MSFRLPAALAARPSSKQCLATPFASLFAPASASGLSTAATASHSHISHISHTQNRLGVPNGSGVHSWAVSNSLSGVRGGGLQGRRSASSLALTLPSNAALTALRESLVERLQNTSAQNDNSNNHNNSHVNSENSSSCGNNTANSQQFRLNPAMRRSLRTALAWLGLAGASVAVEAYLKQQGLISADGGLKGLGGFGGGPSNGFEDEEGGGAGSPLNQGRGWGLHTWTQGLSGQYPLVVELLLASNVLVFLLGLVPANAAWMKANLAISPYTVFTQRKLHTLLTSAFVHLGPVHLFMNCYGLALFGAPLVRQLGDLPFLGTLGVTAVTSSLVGTFLQAKVGPLAYRQAAWFVPGIGMSGALMAFFAMRALSHPHDQYKIALLPMPYLDAQHLFMGFVGLDLAGLLIPAFFGLRGTGVHHGAHLGGYAAGIVLYQILKAIGYM